MSEWEGGDRNDPECAVEPESGAMVTEIKKTVEAMRIAFEVEATANIKLQDEKIQDLLSSLPTRVLVTELEKRNGIKLFTAGIGDYYDVWTYNKGLGEDEISGTSKGQMKILVVVI